MSALCQKRTHAAQQRGLLFDYFVDTAKQGNRHCDAECLRCLEVDNELDFRCLLDWQVGCPLWVKSGPCPSSFAHTDYRCSLSLDRPAECAEIPLVSRCRDAIGRLSTRA